MLTIKKITDIRSKSKAYEIRNIIGSHTLDYITKDDNGNDYVDIMCYRNAAALFSRWGEIMFLKSKKNGIKNLNLLCVIDEYNAISENILKEILYCVIKKTKANDNKSFIHVDNLIKQMSFPFDYRSIIPNRK